MSECVNCHRPLRGNFKVCPYCGTPVMPQHKLRCGRCNAELRENFSFCPKCGNPVNKSEKTPEPEVTMAPQLLPDEFRVAYFSCNDYPPQLVEGLLCISQCGVTFKDLLGTSHDHSIEVNSIKNAEFTSKYSGAPKGHCYVITLKGGEKFCYCYTYFQDKKLYKAHCEFVKYL